MYVTLPVVARSVMVLTMALVSFSYLEAVSEENEAGTSILLETSMLDGCGIWNVIFEERSKNPSPLRRRHSLQEDPQLSAPSLTQPNSQDRECIDVVGALLAQQ